MLKKKRVAQYQSITLLVADGSVGQASQLGSQLLVT